MNTKIEDLSRAQIAEFLPEAIRAALNSYQEFSDKEVGDKEKEFKEHHTACKVAISHIDLLLKLARWADLPDGAIESQNHQCVVAAIEEAEKELKGYEEPEGTENEDS